MSEWRHEGEALVRDMKFDDFAGAMAWNNVRLIPTTRSAGRRTENDHEMARRIGAR